MVAILGVGLFALPSGIIAAGFIGEIRSKKERSVCPHCGKPLSGEDLQVDKTATSSSD